MNVFQIDGFRTLIKTIIATDTVVLWITNCDNTIFPVKSRLSCDKRKPNESVNSAQIRLLWYYWNNNHYWNCLWIFRKIDSVSPLNSGTKCDNGFKICINIVIWNEHFQKIYSFCDKIIVFWMRAPLWHAHNAFRLRTFDLGRWSTNIRKNPYRNTNNWHRRRWKVCLCVSVCVCVENVRMFRRRNIQYAKYSFISPNI